eukprot:Nk52_evm1s1143 gene=Nk52_evmTU1s1143
MIQLQLFREHKFKKWWWNETAYVDFRLNTNVSHTHMPGKCSYIFVLKNQKSVKENNGGKRRKTCHIPMDVTTLCTYVFNTPLTELNQALQTCKDPLRGYCAFCNTSALCDDGKHRPSTNPVSSICHLCMVYLHTDMIPVGYNKTCFELWHSEECIPNAPKIAGEKGP